MYTDQGRPPLLFCGVATLSDVLEHSYHKERIRVYAGNKGSGWPSSKIHKFLHVHITVLGSCPRINTCLGNNFPSHPNLPVAFPSVEFAMPSLFSQKFKATESKWEIILEFLYFMAEHLLHAQEPVRAVLRPQPQVGFLCAHINLCTSHVMGCL